jgi:hypothetical protein
MIPTLVREPFHRDGWVYQEKVDGWRILAPVGSRESFKCSRYSRSARFGEAGRDPTLE